MTAQHEWHERITEYPLDGITQDRRYPDVQYVEFVDRLRALKWRPKSERFEIKDHLLEGLAYIARNRGVPLEKFIEDVLWSQLPKFEYDY